jgi:hypothetical protein
MTWSPRLTSWPAAGPPAGPPAGRRRYMDVLILAAIWATVFLVYWQPLTALTLDDYNVLPERAAMSSNVEWLRHLVSMGWCIST